MFNSGFRRIRSKNKDKLTKKIFIAFLVNNAQQLTVAITKDKISADQTTHKRNVKVPIPKKEEEFSIPPSLPIRSESKKKGES